MGKGERKLYVCTDDDCTMLSMELLSGESGEGGSAVILFATVTTVLYTNCMNVPFILSFGIKAKLFFIIFYGFLKDCIAVV